MRLGKMVIVGLLSAALVSPAVAANGQAVRPTVKAVSLTHAQQRLQPIRSNARAGAKLESANAAGEGSGIWIIGGLAGLLFLALANTGGSPASP
jgi:hypothetical protein